MSWVVLFNKIQDLPANGYRIRIVASGARVDCPSARPFLSFHQRELNAKTVALSLGSELFMGAVSVNYVTDANLELPAAPQTRSQKRVCIRCYHTNLSSRPRQQKSILDIWQPVFGSVEAS